MFLKCRPLLVRSAETLLMRPHQVAGVGCLKRSFFEVREPRRRFLGGCVLLVRESTTLGVPISIRLTRPGTKRRARLPIYVNITCS